MAFLRFLDSISRLGPRPPRQHHRSRRMRRHPKPAGGAAASCFHSREQQWVAGGSPEPFVNVIVVDGAEDDDGAALTSTNTAMSDLTDDLLDRILLRLSPEQQQHRRASLVCRSWHRILSDPGFRRRYSDLHREEILIRQQCERRKSLRRQEIRRQRMKTELITRLRGHAMPLHMQGSTPWLEMHYS